MTKEEVLRYSYLNVSRAETTELDCFISDSLGEAITIQHMMLQALLHSQCLWSVANGGGFVDKVYLVLSSR